MISVSEQKSVLTIQDVPAGAWIGAFFITALLIGCIISWLPDILVGKGLISSTILLSVFTAGLIYCLGVPTTEARFDRNLRQIFISKRSLLRRTYTQYRFEDVEGGALLRVDYDDRGIPRHWVELLIRDQPPIKLCVPDRAKDNAVIAAVPTINSFLGIELSSDDFQLTQIED